MTHLLDKQGNPYMPSVVPVTAGQLTHKSIAFAANASLSDAVDLETMRLGRIVMPSTAQGGWTPADITLQTSHDGVEWRNQYNGDGTEWTLKGALADRSVFVPSLADMMTTRWVRLRSGTLAIAVPQQAARSLVLVLVPQ